MKKLATIFFALTISLSVQAQYNQGVYVTDTLYTGVYGSIAFCTPNPDVTLTADSTLYNNVTGLNYQFIVTGISAPGIGSPSTGPFVVGDTLPLSPGVEHSIFFPAGGTLNYILQAYGTPQLANELYYCDIGTLFTLGFCDNYAYFYPDSAGSQCLVGTVVVQERSEVLQKVFPNPAVESILLDNVDEGIEYTIIDSKGIELLNGNYNSEPIDLSELSPALYSIVIGTRDRTSSLRFLKLDHE